MYQAFKSCNIETVNLGKELRYLEGAFVTTYYGDKVFKVYYEGSEDDYQRLVTFSPRTCMWDDNDINGHWDYYSNNGSNILSYATGGFYYDGVLLREITITSKEDLDDCKGYRAFQTINFLAPSKTFEIPDEAFYKAESLTSVTLRQTKAAEDGSFTIGKYAFNSCVNLSRIDILRKASDIGENALSGTAWYNAQPDGIVLVNSDFGDILYKYKGKVPENAEIEIPASTSKISPRAFEYQSGITSLKLNQGLRTIGGRAFENASKLTGTISFPSSMESISGYIFPDDCLISEMRFEDSETSLEIGDDLFVNAMTKFYIGRELTGEKQYSCKNLHEITYGKNIKKINDQMGPHTFSLDPLPVTKITSLATVPPVIETKSDVVYDPIEQNYVNKTVFAAFQHIDPSSIELCVPAESVEAYKAADGWKDFFKITGIQDSSVIGIEGENIEASSADKIYDLNGIPAGKNYKGIVIVKKADGTVTKQIRK